jgi:mRNA interferase MazF
MSYRAYYPKRGDLIHMTFLPTAGHEMADRQYAFVLSAASYSRKSAMAVVCVITSRVRGGPFEVAVPPDPLPPKAGIGKVQSVILADSVRQVDYRKRESVFVAAAPRALVNAVLDKLLAVLEDD